MPDGRERLIHVRTSVRLETDEVFFGPGVAQLLGLVEQTGSLQESCRRMGISYSKGRHIMKRAERHLGRPLVERWTGGISGGGSALTKEGKQLLYRYQELVERVGEAAECIFQQCFGKETRD